MKDADNIKQLASLEIDYIGFIFHRQSPRCFFYLDDDKSTTSNKLVESLLNNISQVPANILKTGVVVNQPLELVFSYIDTFDLDAIQLHGSEDIDYCEAIKHAKPDIKIIKAISVSAKDDLTVTKQYDRYGVCDYLLFDTKTPAHGGSGVKFDWSILESYDGNIPFWLSGGITSDDGEAIKSIKHPKLEGIDLNSRFEIQPGLKNISLLDNFIKNIRS